ncbi:MAG: PAS domain-containing protein [Prolixibacteraceae bacterium]|nr:PAS domain-containing protein [Prolixibacteraceae bacterium]MBN2773084.1 PAS domain-containing protein [Prolixibacteraceae bacterium]
MSYHYEINSLIEFITAVAAVITVIILWKYKKAPGVKYLIFLELSVAIRALSYAFEFGTNVLEEKILWSKISYFGIAYLPVLYFLFTTGFSQKKKWIAKNKILLLCILPTIMIPIVFTNDYHHLVWTDVILDEQENIAHYFHGFAFWIFFLFTELLIFAGLYNLLSSVYKFSSYYRSQVYTLVIGSVIPVIGNLLYVSKINPFPGFDWTPVSFVITGFIISLGVIRFRIFDLVPLARNKLLDIINDSIIVVNSEGIIEDCNPAAQRLSGNSGLKITGRSFNSVFKGFEKITKEFDDSAEKRIEYSTGNNKYFYDILITPLKNIEERTSGHLLIFHDITKIKNAEESVKEVNKNLLKEIEKKEKLIEDLDAFAHTVAHDIKNPLGAIQSTISLIPECLERNDLELLEELIGMIQISANKSVHITNELLTLASVRKQSVKTTLLDMDVIFTEAKVRLFNIINERNVKIEKPHHWPRAIGYASWVEEVWFNYLSNAIKYGGNPPIIKVGADSPENGFIRFWIKDNGNGISEEAQKLLFNQFTRLVPEYEEGHGLGLSIVKRIIDKLGGVVGIESSSIQGEGSLFYFTLPAFD